MCGFETLFGIGTKFEWYCPGFPFRFQYRYVFIASSYFYVLKTAAVRFVPFVSRKIRLKSSLELLHLLHYAFVLPFTDTCSCDSSIASFLFVLPEQ